MRMFVKDTETAFVYVYGHELMHCTIMCCIFLQLQPHIDKLCRWYLSSLCSQSDILVNSGRLSTCVRQAHSAFSYWSKYHAWAGASILYNNLCCICLQLQLSIGSHWRWYLLSWCGRSDVSVNHGRLSTCVPQVDFGSFILFEIPCVSERLQYCA